MKNQSRNPQVFNGIIFKMSCHIGIDNGRIQYNTLSPIPNRQHTVNCGWPHPYNRLKQWTNQDHPRACGANNYLGLIKQDAAGSSPRMRGKLLPGNPDSRRARIIPAHAGQTYRGRVQRRAIRPVGEQIKRVPAYSPAPSGARPAEAIRVLVRDYGAHAPDCDVCSCHGNHL